MVLFTLAEDFFDEGFGLLRDVAWNLEGALSGGVSTLRM